MGREGGKVVTAAERSRRILFICNENSNRSQMAEAFAHIYGVGWVEAYSAGCRPARAVDPKAIAAMHELGYDLRQHFPKGLADLPDVEYDVAVLMCDDGSPGVRAKRRERWNVPVPKRMPPDEFRAVRDEIGEKVRNLLDGFGTEARSHRAGRKAGTERGAK
jgi:protein-tyrosine-phosphatase